MELQKINSAMPVLSIVVPVYNKEQYIASSVQSILNQTLVDFELILVNDGSTDRSGEICEFFSQQDSRIILIHQANQGVHAARNAGIRIAVGQYLGFVDCDDLLEPRMYETMLAKALKFDADISICGVKRVSATKTELFGGKNKLKVYYKDAVLSAFFTGEILLSVYDKIYRRELVKHLAFEPAVFEDAYYNFLAFSTVEKTVYHDEILYSYMVRDNSESMKAFNQKYMNAIGYTNRMIQACRVSMPAHLDEAKAMGFNTGMLLLNLILIASRAKHIQDYLIVKQALSAYGGFYSKVQWTLSRYKYGYSIFRFSPDIYCAILKVYSNYTNSEHLSRKRKLVPNPG